MNLEYLNKFGAGVCISYYVLASKYFITQKFNQLVILITNNTHFLLIWCSRKVLCSLDFNCWFLLSAPNIFFLAFSWCFSWCFCRCLASLLAAFLAGCFARCLHRLRSGGGGGSRCIAISGCAVGGCAICWCVWIAAATATAIRWRSTLALHRQHDGNYFQPQTMLPLTF